MCDMTRWEWHQLAADMAGGEVGGAVANGATAGPNLGPDWYTRVRIVCMHMIMYLYIFI